MSQMIEGPRKSFLAAAAIGANLRVKITDASTSPPTINVAGASDPSIGVVEDAVLAAGPCTVLLANAQGTRKMVCSDAITGGNSVYAAASGKVASTGTLVEGKAMETTTANNDILEVLSVHNSDISTDISSTTAAAFEVDVDASTPKIALSGQAAGTGDFTTTLKPEATLSADNAIIVPESDGDTLAAIGLAQTFSAIKTMGDDIDLAFGASNDTLIRFSTADASNPATVIALDDTSQQVHITDKAAVATDWARSAGTHPELAIHSNTTPITDYLAIGNHDGTTASVDVVGGTTFEVKIAGTAEATFTAAATTLPGQLSATESVANTAGVGITGSAETWITSVEKIGSIIKTTMLIDLTGLNSGGTADDIIGADGAGVAHLGQITTALNGVITAARLTCLETPATGDDDINVWSATEATGVEDTAISALTETQLCNSGDLVAGTVVALTPPAANQYIYLTGGTGDSDATYTAGKLLLEFWGKAS